MNNQYKQLLFSPIVTSNPVALQALGVCSALAVTTSLLPALLMCAALTSVITLACLSVSLIRNYLPHNIRIIIQITIISSFVIIADQIIKAYAYELSKQLSVFVGLIISNCIVLGRTEGFATKNTPLISLVDGLGHGLGYSLVLILVASIRELFGSGTLLGISVLPLLRDGGWYPANGIMLMAPSGFFIIGLLIWLLQSWKRAPAKADEFQVSDSRVGETS